MGFEMRLMFEFGISTSSERTEPAILGMAVHDVL
jgi:hypothetical protein